jgi:hypothetical protein
VRVRFFKNFEDTYHHFSVPFKVLVPTHCILHTCIPLYYTPVYLSRSHVVLQRKKCGAELMIEFLALSWRRRSVVTAPSWGGAQMKRRSGEAALSWAALTWQGTQQSVRIIYSWFIEDLETYSSYNHHSFVKNSKCWIAFQSFIIVKDHKSSRSDSRVGRRSAVLRVNCVPQNLPTQVNCRERPLPGRSWNALAKLHRRALLRIMVTWEWRNTFCRKFANTLIWIMVLAFIFQMNWG